MKKKFCEMTKEEKCKEVRDFADSFLIALFFAIVIIGFTSCDGYDTPVSERKCMETIMKYQNNFDNYLHFKYDGYDHFQTSFITPPEEWIKVAENCPDLYEKYIVPIQFEWDSIRRIPREITLYEGISDDVLKYKLRIKELEKYKGKIKKSDNAEINMGDRIYVADTTLTDF